MTHINSRYIRFGGASVQLEYTGSRATEIVDFLFPSPADHGAVDADVKMRLQENPDDGELELHCAGQLRKKHHSPGVIAHEVVEAACFHLAGESKTGIVLHAAALSWDGQALLFPGRSGSGKTTLSGFLRSHGIEYLSDELIYIADGTLTVEAFARPLKIKKAGIKVLGRHLGFGDNQARTLRNDRDLLFATEPQRVSPVNTVAGIIFPRYVKRARFRLDPVTPAQAGLNLMECLLNARNLSGHGFSEVTRLARAVPAFALRYANLEQVGRNLDSIRALATPLGDRDVPANG